MTPLEAATGRRPNLAAFHPIGVRCFSYVQNKLMLEPRATAAAFLGYDKNSPAYLIYQPHTGKVIKVRQLSFT